MHHVGVRLTWPSIKTNVVEALGGSGSVDVFVYAYKAAADAPNLRQLYGESAILRENVSDAPQAECDRLHLGHWYSPSACDPGNCPHTPGYTNNAGAGKNPSRGCSAYTMLQQMSGWLGCASMVHAHRQAHGVRYDTFAYTRPDIYYATPIPPPSVRHAHTLYTPGMNANAMLDTLVVGPYHLVDVALRILHALTRGDIHDSPFGWVPHGYTGAKKYGDVSGGALENLFSAHVRLLNNISVGCLNPWKSGAAQYSPWVADAGDDCPAYAGFAPGAFAFLRVQAQGHPALPCANAGIHWARDEATRSFCSKPPMGSRG